MSRVRSFSFFLKSDAQSWVNDIEKCIKSCQGIPRVDDYGLQSNSSVRNNTKSDENEKIIFDSGIKLEPIRPKSQITQNDRVPTLAPPPGDKKKSKIASSSNIQPNLESNSINFNLNMANNNQPDQLQFTQLQNNHSSNLNEPNNGNNSFFNPFSNYSTQPLSASQTFNSPQTSNPSQTFNPSNNPENYNNQNTFNFF